MVVVEHGPAILFIGQKGGHVAKNQHLASKRKHILLSRTL